jgi:hypothetical protein
MHIFKECPLCEALKHEEKPKLTVRVGHRYKRRDGIYENIVEEIDGVFIAKSGGRFWSNGRKSYAVELPSDLIEDLGPAPLEIKVGKRYIDSRGNVFYVYKEDKKEVFGFWVLHEDRNYCQVVNKIGVSASGIISLVKEVPE